MEVMANMNHYFSTLLITCALVLTIFFVLQDPQVSAIPMIFPNVTISTLPNPTVMPSVNATLKPLPPITTIYPPINVTASTLPNPTVMPTSNVTSLPQIGSGGVPYYSHHYYTNTIDSNGNIHRHYSNYSDFSTHEDLSINVVKAMRIMRIVQLNDTINNLPDSSFVNPAIDRSILRDNVTALNNYIQYDEFHFAISELQDMKKEILGITPYSSALIVDTDAQEKIVQMIDGIVHTTTLTADPSDSIYENNSPPLQPSNSVFPKGLSVLWIPIIGLIAASSALGVLIYKVSVSTHKI